MTRPVSIAQQLEELDYELAQRAKVYPRIAAKEPRRKAELEYHVARLQAARTTLVWLRDHRAQLVQTALDAQQPQAAYQTEGGDR